MIKILAPDAGGLSTAIQARSNTPMPPRLVALKRQSRSRLARIDWYGLEFLPS